MFATVIVLGVMASSALAQDSELKAPRLVVAPAESSYVIGAATAFEAVDGWCVAYVEPEIVYWGNVDRLALRYRGHNSLNEHDDCSFGASSIAINSRDTPEVRGERAHFFVMDAAAVPSTKFYAFPVSEDFPEPPDAQGVRFPPYQRDTYWVSPNTSLDAGNVFGSVEELPAVA